MIVGRSVLLGLFVAGCGSATPNDVPAVDGVEAISFLGDTLRRGELEAEAEAGLLAKLDTARAVYQSDTTSADALIWVGRRTAYLGRYREAIAIYSAGIDQLPEDPRFLRHRGHRWISLRQVDRAIGDLDRAAAMIEGRPDEVEPDGLPNARNIPTSTLHSNIWYHLGLAHYLNGDWTSALAAYRQEAAIASNPDMLVATSWWHYLTLRRLGEDTEALTVLEPITPELDIIENHSYHRLLLLAKGVIPIDSLLPGDSIGASPSDAAIGYGIGAWHLVEGRRAEADSVFRSLVGGASWAPFGVIAAEAELARGPI